jgi:tRNA 2-thiouridine synthesizing protein A
VLPSCNRPRRSGALTELIIDARGHRCPTPTLRLQKALREAPAGAEVRLLADDPMARIDVPHFVQQNGHVLVETAEDGPALSFLVRKAPSGA